MFNDNAKIPICSNRYCERFNTAVNAFQFAAIKKQLVNIPDT